MEKCQPMLSLRLLRQVLLVVALLALGGCTGGGCSGSGATPGVTPLFNGFDPAARVQNAGVARLTDSGVAFMEQNLGTIAAKMLGDSNGQHTFQIPPSNGSYSVLSFPLVQYWVCPDGPDPNAVPPTCVAEIDLSGAQLQIDTTAPHNIHIYGPMPVRIQSLPIQLLWLIIPSDTWMVLNGNAACPPQAEDFADIGLNVQVSIEIDTDPAHARYGYSRIRIPSITITQADLESSIQFCGGWIDEAILNGMSSILIPMLMDSLVGTLTTQIEDKLCQKSNPALDPTCPTGTYDVDGICRYGTLPTDECASTILGTDGNVDFSLALASFSPGTAGGLDYLFAAGGDGLRNDGSGFHWGDLDPIALGATLGLYGGTEPKPVSDCVSPAHMALPTNIPVPTALTGNTVSGWPADLPGPHLGFAISERFANYALAQAYDSGALCLGIGGDTMSALNSNLLAVGLKAPSMSELGRLRSSSPVTIVVRPHAPPSVVFGNGTDALTDPSIRLLAPQMSFDFYVWSLDRYVRALSATADLDVPVNLTMTPDGLLPVIDSIGVQNATVESSPLLRELPAELASALGDLVGQTVGSALGSALTPFDLSSALSSFGLGLAIPDSVDGQGSPGIRKLTEGSDNFLAIFAALQTVSPQPDQLPPTADTWAELGEVDLGTLGPTLAALGVPTPMATTADVPHATLRFGSSRDGAPHPSEWQYRIDDQPWHPFTRARTVELHGMWLLEQGRHLIHVRARVAGEPLSLDPSPAELLMRVDSEPPTVRVARDADGRIAVQASDFVSDDEHVLVRTRLGQGRGARTAWREWSEWQPAAELEPLEAGDAERVEVQASDEEGNVGTVSQALSSGAAGAPKKPGKCSVGDVAAVDGRSGWLALGIGVSFGLGCRRARRRPAGVARRSSTGRARVSLRAQLAALLVVAGAGLNVGCSCGSESQAGDCRSHGDCQELSPGLIGEYCSATVAPDGTLWVAGYLEANWAINYAWGDLVVGPYDGTAVQWSVVDGVPSEPPPDTQLFDPRGFRGGQTERGDDVGLWTSIAVDPNGVVGVAYYDATNRALRYASRQGASWSVSKVDQRPFGDVGRYAKLLFVDGLPVVAYLFIEPGDGGAVRSGVRLAHGSSPVAAESSWTFEEVMADPATPCRGAYCTSGTRCVTATGLCTPASSACVPDCTGALGCVDPGTGPECQALSGASALEAYPQALGLYVAAAPHPGGGLGLAFYDRIHGNLYVAAGGNGQWSPVLVDGESNGTDTGDRGIGASLAIDGAGHFHVSYVDGGSRALYYALVVDGSSPHTPELVDDGKGIGAALFTDGRHRVGEDSNITILPSDEIHITYQDATVGTLRYAHGTPTGDTHAWTVAVVPQDGFAGAFSQQVVVNTAPAILSFWRVASPNAVGNVRVVPAP